MSAIDLLLLILLIFFSTSFLTYAREENEIAKRLSFPYASRLLLAALASNSSFGVRNLELLAIYHCAESDEMKEWLAGELNKTINQTINSLKKDGYNFIFYSRGNGKEMHVWDKQAYVCAQEIDMIYLNFTLDCNSTMELWLGTWPSWIKVKEKC